MSELNAEIEPGPERDARLARMREEGDRMVADLMRKTGDGDTPQAAEAIETSADIQPEPESVVAYDERPPVLALALDHPLTVDGVRFERIELRHPTVRTVRRVAEGRAPVDELFAEMAGVPVAVLLALRWPDAERVTVNARLIAPELRSA